MSTISSTPPTASAAGPDTTAAPDWDAILDRAGPDGPLPRVIDHGGFWEVVIGVHVKLVDALRQVKRQFSRVFVFADTVDARHDGVIDLGGFGDLVIITRRLETNGTLHFRIQTGLLTFLGTYVREIEPANCKPQATTWLSFEDAAGVRRTLSQSGYLTDPLTPQVTGLAYENVALHDTILMPFQALPIDLSLMPMRSCKLLADRMLLAAQELGAQGKGELGLELCGRLREMLALLLPIQGKSALPPDQYRNIIELLGLTPDNTDWQPLALTSASVHELLQPVRLATDQVPYLSASFYGDLAKEHIPALQVYANSYTRMADRALDLDTRKQAARLVLGEKDDAGAFQQLVATQLAENLRLANENVTRAQNAIEPQNANVRRAEKAFKDGLDAWKAAKEAEAAWSIVGAVFTFVSNIGSMFGGNASGAAGAAKAAADVAKTASKLAEIMKTLVKVGQNIQKIVKLCLAIVAAADKIADAGKFASDLAAISKETLSDDAKSAPSAAAQWDQL
jgi:hypothetical protein